MTVQTVAHIDGEPVREATLNDGKGFVAKIIEWGAVLRDLTVPMREGPRRVVLGFEDAADYPAHSPNFGATAGRCANRISDARFILDGQEVQVDRNMAGRDHLHGGGAGFGNRVWRITEVREDAVTLRLSSPDGDMGYPGACEAQVVYQLTAPATLRIEMTAKVDQPSPVNLAHHSYFNLADAGAGPIDDHRLAVMADHYTPLNDRMTPTGEIRTVAGTEYDFCTPRLVRHTAPDGSMFLYDINFVLNRPRDKSLFHAATLTSPNGDLTLEAHTSESGLQIYDGSKVSPAIPGLGGVQYGARSGLCLEAQLFPDAVNFSHFPDPILRPSETYRQITEYRFQAG